MNIIEAAASGDRKETLVALRDAIAQSIEMTESGRDMAALSKRLMEVMDAIDSFPSGELSEFDEVLDEL